MGLNDYVMAYAVQVPFDDRNKEIPDRWDIPFETRTGLRPHLCPVCHGKGTVSAKFYPGSPIGKERQTCRACSGTGYIIC
jgi:hypothetical protein